MRGPAEGLRHGRWAILKHQQGFVWLPALCRGLHLRRVSGSPIGARPQRCPLQTTQNCGKHFYALSLCQTWFCILLPFISLFILTTVL